MTRDEEVLQKFEEKAGAILGKAQQYLTSALPGGPGVFAYVVMSNLVGKLFGHSRRYVEKAANRPITLPDFIYVEPLDEEIEDFFDNERLKSVRSEFPERYEDFSNNDWTTIRQYYMPLYYTLVIKEPFVSEMFSFEIQSQNFKRIIHDFELFPLYKKAIQNVPSASKQNALWKAVSTVVKDTVNDVWNKEYAVQLFEEARANPEVAGLIEKIKSKIGEKVDLEQLSALKEAAQYIAGRSITSETQASLAFPVQAIEQVAEVLPGGNLSVSSEVMRKLHLRTGTKVRILIFGEE
jgi:hypothetical protein